MYIVLAPEELPQLIRAGFVDRDAQLLVFAISGWLAALRGAAPGTSALCADCDHEFSGASLPSAYAVARPFAGGGTSVVTGICAACVARAGTMDGLQEVALRHWRRLLPDAQVIAEGGRA